MNLILPDIRMGNKKALKFKGLYVLLFIFFPKFPVMEE
jgi:hypothetical protein